MLEALKRYLKSINDNDKIVFVNSSVSILIQVISMIMGIVIVPLYLSYFCDSEILGMWYSILSVLNWILDFDLGIGNGLKNYLTTAISKNQNSDVKKYISSAYFSFGIISIVVLIISLILVSVADLNSIFNISSKIISASVLKRTLTIVLVSVVLQILLKLITSIVCALQKNAINQMVNLITNAALLLFLLVFSTGSDSKNLLALAICRGVSVVVPLAVLSVVVFKKYLNFAKPSIKAIEWQYVKRVITLGGIFFIIQLLYVFIMGTNEMLITHFAGNEHNVEYQVYYKIFGMVNIVFAWVSVSLWSVVTKAKAQQNYQWLKKGYKKYLLFSLLFCLGELLLVFIAKPLVYIWLGDVTMVEINIVNSLWFSLCGCLGVLGNTLSAFAMGLEKMKTQTICYIVGAVAKIPLSKLFVEITGSWIGVVIATCICLGVYCVVQFIVFQRYFKSKNFKQA